MMPGMAGPGSLKAVRERFPDLCLVMATASSRREDILLALQAGVHGYIAKSMGLKELSSALKQIVGVRFMCRLRLRVPAALVRPTQLPSPRCPAWPQHLRRGRKTFSRSL
jgi:DNA-binding NarL/FixJ family response regulator